MTDLSTLTERHKSVARWLVEQNRAGNLPEEFHIIWYGGGYHISGFTRSDDEAPYISEGALESLKIAGLLLGYQNQPATMICTMLGTLFDAVDSNFAVHAASARGGISLNISHSTIGLLNTGEIETVGSISVSVSNLVNEGQTEIAEALKQITEAVAGSQDIASTQRNELLVLLEELSMQATMEPGQRAKPSVIKAVLAALAGGLGAAGSLADVWATWGSTIQTFFLGVG